MESLPVDAVIPELTEAIQRGGFVLTAPPGAGKTTRVPPALLPLLPGEIWVLQPRRVAARAAARRMAVERKEAIGQTVGYQVRFERRGGRSTRLWVATGGILLRKLCDDPLLDNISAVIVDETHERALETDLLLALLAEVREARPDLVVGAMSATIDADPLAHFLGTSAGKLPIVRSDGRLHPVDIDYLAYPDDRPVERQVADAVGRVLSEGDGDVLAFLPGVREIRATAELLSRAAHDIDIVPLYGDLSAEHQDRALSPGARRRVVLATNVAETSLTVPGVSIVVDSGLVRRPSRDPATGLDHLDTVQISAASAEQRAGRAGRLGPGRALRLWTERQQRALSAFDSPEIERIDLCGPVLQVLAWGSDPRRFRWLHPPPPSAIDAALSVLADLGAMEGGHITALGQRLARLPLHPRLGRLLIEGARLGQPAAAARTAALLSERDPFAGQLPSSPSPSDLLDRLDRLEEGRLDAATRRAIGAASEQMQRLLTDLEIPGPRAQMPLEEAIGRAILAAWPDRVARRRASDRTRARMVGGAGLKMDKCSAVTEHELFVAVDLVADGADARVRIAQAIEAAWLAQTEGIETVLDETTGAVRARRVVRYRDLVLVEHTAPLDPEAASALLVDAALRDPARVMPNEGPVAALTARLAFLRRTLPDEDWPDLVSLLPDLLPMLCHGARSRSAVSLSDVRNADWMSAITATLGYARKQKLDALAPERITVPSGRAIALDYPEAGPPVLAVKIQELFGLDATPTVAGRVPVKLHLLAPNGRPQQITDDLPGFWRRTWPEVRRELRARYPKHGWPEDPLTATPRARPGKG